MIGDCSDTVLQRKARAGQLLIQQRKCPVQERWSSAGIASTHGAVENSGLPAWISNASAMQGTARPVRQGGIWGIVGAAQRRFVPAVAQLYVSKSVHTAIARQASEQTNEPLGDENGRTSQTRR